MEYSSVDDCELVYCMQHHAGRASTFVLTCRRSVLFMLVSVRRSEKVVNFG